MRKYVLKLLDFMRKMLSVRSQLLQNQSNIIFQFYIKLNLHSYVLHYFWQKYLKVHMCYCIFIEDFQDVLKKFQANCVVLPDTQEFPDEFLKTFEHLQKLLQQARNNLFQELFQPIFLNDTRNHWLVFENYKLFRKYENTCKIFGENSIENLSDFWK